LLQNLNALLKKNYSFLIIGIASISFLTLNILLKDVLNGIEYGMFSILISSISILFSLGLFGFDQVFIRKAIIKENKIKIDLRLIVISLLIMLISTVFFAYIFNRYYDFGIHSFWLYLLIIAILLIKFSYQFLRLSSFFITSQLTLNFWKIGLLFLILICMFLDINISLNKIIFYIISLTSLSLISYFFIINNIEIVRLKNSTSDLLKLGFGFLLVIISVTVLGFFDRFIIERKFGFEALGNYFFYLNVYLYPFLIFSNYIGFKKLIEFKKSFTSSELNKQILNFFKISCLLSILYLLLTIIIDSIGIYNFNIFKNIELILMLIFWGIIRIIASLISSALGAIADKKHLNFINIFTVIKFIIIFLILDILNSIIDIVLVFIIVWILRYILCYFLILKNRINTTSL
jgi:hypothetical protein